MPSEVFNKVVALVTSQEIEGFVSTSKQLISRHEYTDAVATARRADALRQDAPAKQTFTEAKYEYMRTAFREGVPYWAYERIKQHEDRIAELEIRQ